MSSGNLSQSVDSCVQDAATCEACGGAFTCGASAAGCWCVEVKLSESAQVELRGRYQRCLCRACLESFAEEERGAVEESNG
jgi:hypothetical protein